MKCPKHGCVMTETITDDVFCGVCRVAERDARIAELEKRYERALACLALADEYIPADKLDEFTSRARSL